MIRFIERMSEWRNFQDILPRWVLWVWNDKLVINTKGNKDLLFVTQCHYRAWIVHFSNYILVISLVCGVSPGLANNGIWWDCCKSDRFSAIKPGLIQYFLYLKMPVPSQAYDSSCPFVFDVFCHLILPCDNGLSNLIFVWVQYFCDFTFYKVTLKDMKSLKEDEQYKKNSKNGNLTADKRELSFLKW